MASMEKNHLRIFVKPSYSHREGGIAPTTFTSDDKQLQRTRFYYTLNSVLNHSNDCRDKARILQYNGKQLSRTIF